MRTVRGWLETGRSIGFILLLIAGTGLLGFCISWPLWFFATRTPGVYTATVLSLAGAGIAALIARRVLRRRSADGPSRHGAALLAAVISVFMGGVAIVGAFTAAALLARRMWLGGGIEVVLWVFLLWLLGKARRAAKTRKAPGFSAENRGE